MYPQLVVGILASSVRQLFICSDCFHFNNVSKRYVQSFYTCSSQNKTHLSYKVPIFKTPQLNHLIFTQNCQNILIYGISFSSLSFSDNGQTPLFPPIHILYFEITVTCVTILQTSVIQDYLYNIETSCNTPTFPIVNTH